MRIQTLTYDGNDVLNQIVNTNSTGFKDLDDWSKTPDALDNLSLTDIGSSHPLVMNICLDETAGDTLQGDSLMSSFTVVLNQHATQ